MSEANKTLVRRWFEEVWNRNIEATIDELFAEEAIARGLGDTDKEVHGPQEFKPFVRNLRGTLPDLHIHIERMIAEGDTVAAHIVLEGTHTGAQLGDPPTGRRVHIEGIVLVRIANGKIIEGINSYDQLGFLRQTGALAVEDSGDKFLTARS